MKKKEERMEKQMAEVSCSLSQETKNNPFKIWSSPFLYYQQKIEPKDQVTAALCIW